MRCIHWLLPLLIGCQIATGPVDPVWGKQTCAHCMMLLSDPRASAQVQLQEGSHVYFDDIGCMIEWLAQHDEAQRGRWVRDRERWVTAERARYGLGHTTPMDYGLLVEREGMSFSAAQRAVHERSLARKEAQP